LGIKCCERGNIGRVKNPAIPTVRSQDGKSIINQLIRIIRILCLVYVWMFASNEGGEQAHVCCTFYTSSKYLTKCETLGPNSSPVTEGISHAFITPQA
jgi:hypothetical protein